MIDTLIFDFDGTIADTFPLIIKVLNHLAPEFGYKTVEDRKTLEESRNHTIPEILKFMHIQFYKLPFLVKRSREEMQKEITKSNPIKGIKEALMSLKKSKVKLGVISSNSRENVEKFLMEHELLFFDFIYTGTSLFGKQYVIKKVLKKWKLDPATTVYVGDELRDIDAAKKVGIPIAAVTWGFNSHKSLLAKNPEFLIDNPADLQKIIYN